MSLLLLVVLYHLHQLLIVHEILHQTHLLNITINIHINYIPCPIVSNSSSCFIETICFADHTSIMCSLFILRNDTSDDYEVSDII